MDPFIAFLRLSATHGRFARPASIRSCHDLDVGECPGGRWLVEGDRHPGRARPGAPHRPAHLPVCRVPQRDDGRAIAQGVRQVDTHAGGAGRIEAIVGIDEEDGGVRVTVARGHTGAW